MYDVRIVRSAEKEFIALPLGVQQRIKEKILNLDNQPRPQDSKKLQNTTHYRVRIGDYRAIYSVDDQQKRVLVLSIAHRKEVYR